MAGPKGVPRFVFGRDRVAELAFRDGIMDRIRLREPRFDERAYLFVLAALEFCQQRLDERRHITGRELSLACRDLALDRFGVMARVVLEQWGVRSSGRSACRRRRGGGGGTQHKHNTLALPDCRKCQTGTLLPLSDYGRDGA